MACMFTMMNQARLVGRPAGRRHRRARDAAGARLCARAQAGPRGRRARRREPDHRASRRQAHAAHHARAHPRRARHLLRHRGRARPRAAQPRTKPRAGPRTSAPRCSRRSPRRSRPTSASRSPRSACRCTAAWAIIEETGAAQHYRDARIAAIYEGTNGIQAIDLVTRKLPLVGRRRGEGLYRRAAAHGRGGQRRQRSGLRLRPARGSRRRSTASSARRIGCSAGQHNDPDTALAGATPYLRLFALAAGGACWPRRRSRRRGLPATAPMPPARIAIARFFAENLAVQRRRPRAHRDRRRRQRQPRRDAALALSRRHVAQEPDALHHRRVARHRARDRAARRARRRQHRHRRQDRRAASEAAGHDLHRRRGDRQGRRQGAAARGRRARRGAGEGRDRADGRDLRRHRHRGQQCERGPAHAGRRHRHAPLRPDASDQHARHLHGVEIRHPASREGAEPAHPDELAAARHAGEMVRRQHRLFDRQVRHEPGRARPRRRVARRRASRSTRCGRAPPSRPRRSRTCSAASG